MSSGGEESYYEEEERRILNAEEVGEQAWSQDD